MIHMVFKNTLRMCHQLSSAALPADKHLDVLIQVVCYVNAKFHADLISRL